MSSNLIARSSDPASKLNKPGNEPGFLLKNGVCGRSSGVERHLAKVNVVSSNLIARSIFPEKRPLAFPRRIETGTDRDPSQAALCQSRQHHVSVQCSLCRPDEFTVFPASIYLKSMDKAPSDEASNFGSASSSTQKSAFSATKMCPMVSSPVSPSSDPARIPVASSS